MQAVSKNETYFSLGIDEIKLPELPDFKNNFYLIDALCESIKNDGYEPILIDSDSVIVDGIDRYLALVHLHYQRVNVKYADSNFIDMNFIDLPLFAA